MARKKVDNKLRLTTRRAHLQEALHTAAAVLGALHTPPHQSPSGFSVKERPRFSISLTVSLSHLNQSSLRFSIQASWFAQHRLLNQSEIHTCAMMQERPHGPDTIPSSTSDFLQALVCSYCTVCGTCAFHVCRTNTNTVMMWVSEGHCGSDYLKLNFRRDASSISASRNALRAEF